tara:strand:+ start:1732 stop:2217 length:486 start_codon:yes stop_codon:yes gene_type:complete
MKIAVIGNGETALKTKSGGFIDKCRHVIRLGNFIIDNYQDYIGNKTTIIGTSYKKTDNIHLAPFVWYVEDMTDEENSTLTYNLNYDKNMTIESNRPTIGMRTLQKAIDTFPDYTIYVKGFDFLNTGWYWDKDHTYGAVSHPTILEKIYYKKLIRRKKIIEL